MDLRKAVWTRSNRSSATGDNCVEVALNLGKTVAVRDSKHPAGHVIKVSADQWRMFLTTVRPGL
jgi:hypothetical protein